MRDIKRTLWAAGIMAYPRLHVASDVRISAATRD